MLFVLGLTLRIAVLDAIAAASTFRKTFKVGPCLIPRQSLEVFIHSSNSALGMFQVILSFCRNTNRGEEGKQPAQWQRVCILLILCTFIKMFCFHRFSYLEKFHQPPIHMGTAGLSGALSVTQDIISMDMVERSGCEYLAETKIIIIV